MNHATQAVFESTLAVERTGGLSFESAALGVVSTEQAARKLEEFWRNCSNEMASDPCFEPCHGMVSWMHAALHHWLNSVDFIAVVEKLSEAREVAHT